MLQDGASLFKRDAWKPLDKVGDVGAVLQILEKGGHGYAGATEHPGSTHPFRVALHRRAGRPINHGVMIARLIAAASALTSEVLIHRPDQEPSFSA
jgi:hypothetical protein